MARQGWIEMDDAMERLPNNRVARVELSRLRVQGINLRAWGR